MSEQPTPAQWRAAADALRHHAAEWEQKATAQENVMTSLILKLARRWESKSADVKLANLLSADEFALYQRVKAS